MVDEEVKASIRRALARAALNCYIERPPGGSKGVALTPLERVVDTKGYHYRYVDAVLDPDGRTATLTIKAPAEVTARSVEAMVAEGAHWWPLQMARELDDAILNLRTNHLDLGLWVLRTEGKPAVVLEMDALIDATSTIGSCARLSACCAARWHAWTCPRAACTR